MFITMDITYNFFDNPDYPAHNIVLPAPLNNSIKKQLEERFFAPSAIGRPTKEYGNNTD